MKKGFCIALLLLFGFLLMTLSGHRCFLIPGFLPSAWGEESIIETEKWQILEETAVQKGVNRKDLDQILDIVRLAQVEGFPMNPFIHKALEGMAKGVPSATIVRVLETRLEYFRTSRGIMSKMTGMETESDSQIQNTLTILSESMVRGVSREELETLARQAPKPHSVHLANASQDLASFKDLDFPGADAMEIVLTALQHGIYRRRNRETPRAVKNARENGLSDQELKQIFLSNIRRGKGMKGTISGRQDPGRIRQQPRGQGNPYKGGPRSHP